MVAFVTLRVADGFVSVDVVVVIPVQVMDGELLGELRPSCIPVRDEVLCVIQRLSAEAADYRSVSAVSPFSVRSSSSSQEEVD